MYVPQADVMSAGACPDGTRIVDRGGDARPTFFLEAHAGRWVIRKAMFRGEPHYQATVRAWPREIPT